MRPIWTIASVLIGVALQFLLGACSNNNDFEDVSNQVHVFYYAWYGNPETDGSYAHWNHSILPHGPDPRWINAGSYPGGDDIGANFYPELGNYSSNDPELIRKHMHMIQSAGIGVVAISWWGKNDFANESLPLYFDIAEEFGLKICFHIEPIFNSIGAFKELLENLIDRFGTHPALYRYHGKPFYYIYDSYKIAAPEWKRILDPQSEESIRNTPLDGTFIGIWVFRSSYQFFLDSGFDGFYTYYASDKFVWASNPVNWKDLANFAREQDKIFIPSVGPGYIDTRIRPWNVNVTVERDSGDYYRQMFCAAIEADPKFISITSFNEWHEGTQIEPAVPKEIEGYSYENYGSLDPWYYLLQTKSLVLAYQKNQYASSQ